MKATAWIISFSLGVTMLVSLMLDLIQPGIPRAVIFILMVILFCSGYKLMKQDFSELKEEIDEEIRSDNPEP